MPSTELQTRRLDLAARAIDLTLALASTASTSSLAFKIAWEVGQWLGREGVNQFELRDCLEKAKGLVRPNRETDGLFSELLQPSERKSLGPLFLEQHGTLGRLIAQDPSLSWMISTTACLFQYHNDTELISATIIGLIMENIADEHDQESDSLFYKPAQIQIKAVVGKIALSIWHNVVNAGYNIIPLPLELQSTCRHGHNLDPSDFAKVAFALTSRCRSSTILRTRHLLRNITLWLLMHYDGTVVINLSGVIVYQKQVGTADRELEIHVEVFCEESGRCQGDSVEKYTILKDVAGQFESFISGYSMRSTELPSTPGTRQPLYERPQIYPRDSAMWDRGIGNLIRTTAQLLARWLLQTRLSHHKTSPELGYDAILDFKAPNSIQLQNVFYRLPGIMNLRWGIMQDDVGVVYDPHPSYPTGGVDEKDDQNSTPDPLGVLLRHFPLLHDLNRKVRRSCQCSNCDALDLPQGSPLQPGCLSRMALDEVMLMLAHCIADGFGIDDTSGIPNQGSIADAMIALLVELAKGRHVRWDAWFSLAASVYMGCPYKERPGPEHPAFGGTSIVAIQFGGLVVQAPWLDLTTKLSRVGSFGLIKARGRLAANNSTATGNDDSYYRVEENFAIIETEGTEDSSAYVSRFRKDAMSAESLPQLQDDNTVVTSDVILVSVHDCYYRLLTRIKADKHWRIIDPSDAMNAVIAGVSGPSCVHENATVEINGTTTAIKLYDFGEILGRWPDTVQEQMTDPQGRGKEGRPGTTFGVSHVSQNLDTNLKANVANALSVCCTSTTVAQPLSEICAQCLLQFAQAPSRAPLRPGEGGPMSDRYIINLSSRLTKQLGGYITR